MTEQEFDQKVEQWAQQFEQWADDTAGRFEERMTRAWNKPLFRLFAGGLSAAAGLGLLVAARRFCQSGHRTAALWSAGAAAAVLAAELVRMAVIRRKP